MSDIYDSGVYEGSDAFNKKKPYLTDFEMSSKKSDYKIGYVMGYVQGMSPAEAGSIAKELAGIYRISKPDMKPYLSENSTFLENFNS